MTVAAGARTSLTGALQCCVLVALVGVGLPLTGCHSSNPPSAASESPAASSASSQSPQNTQAAQAGEKRYHLEGTVVQIDKAHHRLIVDHKEIPGFMAAMTMPYPVADDKTLDRVAVGDQITADVVVPANMSGIRLDNVVVVKKADGSKPAPSSQLLPKGGDDPAVPDFAMVNQDGKRIDLSQYRGKTLLMTFIYTRCPVPDMCPLVTHEFAQVEKRLAQNPELYARTHLLSVSFDSTYDTPQVLRNYARAFVGAQASRTFAHWEFATIPANELSDVTSFFNIFVSTMNGQITHSMATVIVSPSGRLLKQFHDNDWKPAEMLVALNNAASPSRTSLQAASR